MTEMVGAGNPPLPPVIRLSDPDRSYDIWTLWRATDRRFLPSQLMNEPEGLLMDMLTLDGIYEKIKEAANGTKDD